MKISTNIIGNYGPRIKQAFSPKPAQAAPEKSPGLNDDEKNFFINKYPANKQEIADYHCYGKSGAMQGISKGSLINRRG